MALRRQLVALVAAVVVAAAAGADYRDQYKQGVEAYDRGNMQEATRALRQAIAEKPEASGLLSGALLRRYTPHYYLGMALAELGECREAIEVLDESERQGKLGRDELDLLTASRTRCRERLAAVETVAAAARSEVDEASAAAFGVAQIEAAPVLSSQWDQGSPSFAGRQEEAVDKLARARSLLQEGESRLDTAPIEQAAGLAREARRELETLQLDAEARRDELQGLAEQELAELEGLVDASRKDVRFVANNLSPLPDSLTQVIGQLERQIDAAVAANLATPVGEVRALQDRLRQQLSRLRRAVQAPPNELMEAAAAYFAADYPGSLELLAEVSFDEPRARAHACLLRAASHHALWRLSGGADDDHLQAARDELARCAELDVIVPPVEGAFSPAFVEFHRQSLPAPGVAAEVLAPAPPDG